MEQEPRQRLPTIHVAYATTPDGFPGLLHSLNSLARNVPSEESLSVHVVVPQDHVDRAKAILGCFSDEVAGLPPRDLHVQVYPMRRLGFDTGPMLNTTRGWMRSWGNLRLSRPTVFARFYLHEMLPREVERVLWLDVDTIVKGDLGPLYRMRMTRPVAARMPGANRTVGAAFPRWSCVQHLDPAASFPYFNTGVMVMNMSWFRTEDFTRPLEKAAYRCTTNDQPSMNIVFMDRGVDFFNRTFNVMSMGNPGRRKRRWPDDAVILHWQGPVKPWEQPEKCGQNATLQEVDPDCLSGRNMREWMKYRPHHRCTAVSKRALAGL